jgi:hypothetical protein
MQYLTLTDYSWTKEELFTGDVIETICDFIFDIENYITGDHGREKTNLSKHELIQKQIDAINLQMPEIVFVYGHDIDNFVNYLDKIQHKFKLVTHNSDIGVEERHVSFLNNAKIIKWFAQNTYIQHPKLTTLPIGIARSKYAHGNVDMFTSLTTNNIKNNLVYKNFDTNTNLHIRNYIDVVTSKNHIKMQQNTSCYEYWKSLSSSVFSISPPGNGIDCHRIWESLYLKTIPIVKAHEAFNQFRDLPILFIENWEEITIDFLRKNLFLYEKLNTKIEKLKFSFWKDLITS